MSNWKKLIDTLNTKNIVYQYDLYVHLNCDYITTDYYIKLLLRTGFIEYNNITNSYITKWKIPEGLKIRECAEMKNLGTMAAWFCYPENRIKKRIVRDI